MYIKVSILTSDESFSGITVPVNIQKDNKKIEKLIKASRKNWATKYQKPVLSKTSNGHVKQTEETENAATAQGGVPRIPENETIQN